ncbi:MAG: urease accessory protein UreE [Chitinophagaceae bacterium]|nr:urease accessory protein UreE [Chitinophagaceae bacterium]
MIITKKASTLTSFDLASGTHDTLRLEWYETNKRILHKQTSGGQKISIKFLQENPDWKEGEIVFADDKNWISVEIISCEAMVLTPGTIIEAAAISYEIGNKHLPLFYENNELLVPFDPPLLRLLQASGYAVKVEIRKLQHPLKTSVSPHGHTESSGSLFNKILRLTTNA